jgi:hypothetical protein
MVCGVGGGWRGGGGGVRTFSSFSRGFSGHLALGAQLLCDRRGELIFSPIACAPLQPSRVIALKLSAE